MPQYAVLRLRSMTQLGDWTVLIVVDATLPGSLKRGRTQVHYFRVRAYVIAYESPVAGKEVELQDAVIKDPDVITRQREV